MDIVELLIWRKRLARANRIPEAEVVTLEFKTQLRLIIATLEKAVDAIRPAGEMAWQTWLVYLLECLQDETDAEHYEEFLRDIKGAIDARLEDGRW